jgi:hypothetical protein
MWICDRAVLGRPSILPPGDSAAVQVYVPSAGKGNERFARFTSHGCRA